MKENGKENERRELILLLSLTLTKDDQIEDQNLKNDSFSCFKWNETENA